MRYIASFLYHEPMCFCCLLLLSNTWIVVNKLICDKQFPIQERFVKMEYSKRNWKRHIIPSIHFYSNKWPIETTRLFKIFKSFYMNGNTSGGGGGSRSDDDRSSMLLQHRSDGIGTYRADCFHSVRHWNPIAGTDNPNLLMMGTHFSFFFFKGWKWFVQTLFNSGAAFNISQ